MRGELCWKTGSARIDDMLRARTVLYTCQVVTPSVKQYSQMIKICFLLY
jgi:hypothetical protein